MRIYIFQIILFFFVTYFVNAQSTLITPGSNGSVTVPNLTNDQITAISNPQKGMVAYDISFNCLRVYNGSEWICTFQDIGVNKTVGSAKGFGSDGYDEATNVVLDENGNLYVLINTSMNTTQLRGTVVLLKLDPNLNIIWSKTIINASASGLCYDSQQNICIAGTFVVYTTIGNTTLIPVGSNDIFIAKFNSSGSPLWAKSFGSSELDFVNSLTSDINNNLYITSVWNSNFISYDGNTAITKYDANGNQIFNWTSIVSPSSTTVKTYGDANGNLYLAGRFYSSNGSGINIGGTTVYPNPNNNSSPYNNFVAKLNSNGNVIWVKGSQHHLWDMAFDEVNSSIYIIGEFFGQMIFNNIPYNTSGNTDIFTGKLNINGDTVWMKQITGKTGFEVRGGLGINFDDLQNVYITGYFGNNTNTMTMEFGTTTFSNVNGLDGYVAKYNSLGQPQWIERFAGTNNEKGNKLAIAKNGNVYIVGSFSGQTRFQFSPTTTNYITSSGGTDAFIALYKQLVK
ncbi:hypothetical protein GCM10027035_44950 [Emticicia sediminis]